MNIFEKVQTAKSELDEQIEKFVYLAVKVINDINPDSESKHHFIESYHGFHANAYPYDAHNYIDNPHYNPNLTPDEHRKPENYALQTGFSKIAVKTQMVSITAEESQDPYDDCAGEPERWHFDVPLELFLNGTESEIYKHFYDKWSKNLIDEKEIAFNNHWQKLLDYDFNELQKFVEISKQYYSAESGYISYNDFLKVLNEFKGELK